MDRRCMQCARWCGVPRAPLHSLMPRRQIKSISAPVPHLTVPSCRHSTPPPLRLSSVCYWVRPDVVGYRRDRECRVARPAPSAHVMAGLRPPPLVPTFAPGKKGKPRKEMGINQSARRRVLSIVSRCCVRSATPSFLQCCPPGTPHSKH